MEWIIATVSYSDNHIFTGGKQKENYHHDISLWISLNKVTVILQLQKSFTDETKVCNIKYRSQI